MVSPAANSPGAVSHATPPLPAGVRRPSPFLLALYYIAVRIRVGWNFQSLRIANSERFPAGPGPLIVFGNHPSWWDPVPALLAHHAYRPESIFWAPSDTEVMKQNGYLRYLGFFPVKTGTIAGTKQFLQSASDLLTRQDTVLWVTPAGELHDPRERPVRFRRGLAALVSGLENVTVVPMALEYPFWDTQRPEMLVSWGEPIHIADGRSKSTGEWHQLFQEALATAQDELAELSIAREANRFRVLFYGHAGLRNLLRLIRSLGPLFRRR